MMFNDHSHVYDSVGATNAWWYHFPSLAVNCQGDMVLGFSGSSATNYIGALYACRLANGGMLGSPRLLQAGLIAHSGRWGDYSATTLDPTDDWSFWTVQEYATPQGLFSRQWATVISHIRASP